MSLRESVPHHTSEPGLAAERWQEHTFHRSNHVQHQELHELTPRTKFVRGTSFLLQWGSADNYFWNSFAHSVYEVEHTVLSSVILVC